jgi:uncharacterized protein
MEGPTIRLSKSVEEKTLVITCFPSIGMVSSIVAHYLIDNLELEFIGGIVDDRLPPIAILQKGEPLPPIRAYSGKHKCSIRGCSEVILLMSELVVPDPLVHKIVWTLFEWSKENNIQAGVLIDAFAKNGMSASLDGTEPVINYDDTDAIDVIGIGANEATRDLLSSMGIQLAEGGVVRGMNGGLLAEAMRRGIDTMSLMVEANPTFPDARAAAALIEQLNHLLPTIDLDHAPLIEEAEEIEQSIKAMMEGMDMNLEHTGGPNSMLYG